MPVVNNPLKSLYGFQSPSFSVNAAGNLIANNITVNNVTANDITAAGFSTLTDLLVTANTELQGTFAVDGAAVFNDTVNITDTNAAESLISAALVVSGGVAIQNNLRVNNDSIFNSNVFIGQNLLVQNNIQANNSLITNSITSVDDGSTLSDLTIEPLGDVIFKTGSQSVEVGRIDATGSTVPVQNTTINNTTIGLTVASTAAFVSGTVVNTPTAAANITRKDYVDRTALAYAVAFGA
jgi:hypothetical protein